MPILRKQFVRSLPEYLEQIERAQSRVPHSLWYRGCGSAADELLPSLYRHKHLTTPEQLAELERKLMVRFRQDRKSVV